MQIMLQPIENKCFVKFVGCGRAMARIVRGAISLAANMHAGSARITRFDAHFFMSLPNGR
jgi:hypothetical protein